MKIFLLVCASCGIFISGALYAAAPTTIDSPVRGEIVYAGQQSNKWHFNQYEGIRHIVGGGIGNADDRKAFDINYGRRGDDNCDFGTESTCKKIYAVESGCFYKSNGWGGGSVGQLLINHTSNGQEWSSSYLHLINRTNKSCVRKGEEIGMLSDVGAPGNYHLHFAIYDSHGKSRLTSVKPTITQKNGVDIFSAISMLLNDDSETTPRGDSINIEDLPSLPYLAENGITYNERIVFRSSSTIRGQKAHGATYLTSASEQWVVCPGTSGPAGITVYSAYEARRNFVRSPFTGQWALDTTSPAFRSPFFEVDYTAPLYDLTFDVIFNGIFFGIIPDPQSPPSPCALPNRTVPFGAVLFNQSDVVR